MPTANVSSLSADRQQIIADVDDAVLKREEHLRLRAVAARAGADASDAQATRLRQRAGRLLSNQLGLPRAGRLLSNQLGLPRDVLWARVTTRNPDGTPATVEYELAPAP